MQSTQIKLIVGLGNPGPDYHHTRHNAGAWFVEKIAEKSNLNLSIEKKFFGQCCQLNAEGNICRLIIPNTFMNHSGRAVSAIANFYQIPVANILVAHDELDLPTGVARLKRGGGAGGHNGLRDIIAALGADFMRLRLGIGHPGPGQKDQVLNYVLGTPSSADRGKIFEAVDKSILVLPMVLRGEFEKAMNQLHTEV